MSAIFGVLALQGGYPSHARLLERVGVAPREVRKPAELAGLDALVLPGGESTVIHKLAAERGLLDAIRGAAGEGLGLLGTCAGAILLAREVEDHPDFGLGLLDIAVRRNAYGRQRESFVSEEGGRRRVFIRAPRILATGEGVEVLDALGDAPVAVAAGRVLAATYHPELADDPWLVEELRRRMA